LEVEAFLIGLQPDRANQNNKEVLRMGILARIDRFGREQAHRPRTHVLAAVLFVLVNAAGYRFAGGLEFVQGWGGGLAAVIATFFLVWKSQGYWAWMIVNAALWCALFFHQGLPLLGWLQVAFLVFASYGLVQWMLVRSRIGWDPRVPADAVGGVLGVALLVYALVIYRDMPGYTGTGWWWLELASVAAAISAMWMDAFRYKLNWWAWSLSNAMFLPLALHGRLWGPFAMTFVYQAINVAGWFQWTRDERRLQPLPEAATA
jgi:Nicotinamide mononucleotide transporter